MANEHVGSLYRRNALKLLPLTSILLILAATAFIGCQTDAAPPTLPAAIATPSAGISPTETSPPNDPQSTLDVIALGLIAFTSDRDGNAEIYAVDANGERFTRLTNNEASDTGPAWSPDGKRLVFTSDRQGNKEVFVIDADSTDAINLSREPGQDMDPAWSPDGETIAFTSARDGVPRLFLMHSSGLDQRGFDNDGHEENTTPAWSSDGTKIAFTSDRNGLNISVMDADGANETALTKDPTDDAGPSWSPDGTQIAFHSRREGNAEIYVMNADGSGQTRVTNSPSDDLWPSWSRDGSMIAFESDRDGSREIYIMRPDGTELRQVTTGGGYAPAWSPVPTPGKVTLYLVKAEDGAHLLSLSPDSPGGLTIVEVPLLFNVPVKDRAYLRKFLWTDSSLVFSGTGISGSWPFTDWARLVMQLNGPLNDADYYRCAAFRINGEEAGSSCGEAFDSHELVTGGYQVVAGLPAPLVVDANDLLEVSIVMATVAPPGGKVVPDLVFGGDVPLKTSFIEIGISRE